MLVRFNRDVSAGGWQPNGHPVYREFDKYDELQIVAAKPSPEFPDMTLVTFADDTEFPLMSEDIEISH